MKIDNGIQSVDKSSQNELLEQQKIRKVAQQFESLLMNTLLKSMRSTVQSSDLIDNDGEIKHYREMMDTELSNSLSSRSNGLGIADMIIRQYGQPPVSTTESGNQMKPLNDKKVFSNIPAMNNRSREAYNLTSGSSLKERAFAINPALADTVETYSKQIEIAASKSGLRAELIVAVMNTESNGDSDAVSVKGASGLMQLMPGTAKDLGVTDIFDSEQNITAGAEYLSKMLHRFDGDIELSLAAYNAGPGNVEKANNKVPNFIETQNYVKNVKSTYSKLCDGKLLPPQKLRSQ